MIKINKMVKEHSVDQHPSPSRLTSTDTPSHISIEPLGFYLSPEHSLNFRCISHNGWGFFSNLWCSDYWKMHLRVRKLNLEVFIHAS